MKKTFLKHLFLSICLYTVPTFSLFAGETLEFPGNQEDLNVKLIALLSKLDSKYYLDEKTRGFTYRYRDKWYDPFDYNIYIGKVGKTSPDSVLRVESFRTGQERMWRQIFEQEIVGKPARENAKELQKKYMIFSQGLNLVTPVASIAYNSWNSPVYTTKDTIISMSFYFLLDLIVAGGAYYYAEQKLHNKTIWDNLANSPGPGNVWESPDGITVITALAISRGLRAFDAFGDTASHNRAAQFSWKFQF